jgi:hypothetical protein
VKLNSPGLYLIRKSCLNINEQRAVVTKKRNKTFTHEDQVKGKAVGDVTPIPKEGVLPCQEVCSLRPLVLLIRAAW